MFFWLTFINVVNRMCARQDVKIKVCKRHPFVHSVKLLFKKKQDPI